ncbi:topology modulation protein [Streptomyces sp900129855]|uniref:Topology modulation protein n=1 Tax=Streptomyces sp. 900129855 TaxID=3155129 RepID=A0ABV2ZLI4_9ACTN
MDKVLVIGCAGSGKTRVARELGRHLNAPVTHLDALYYDADWNPLPMDDFAEAQRDVTSQPRWVIDGNYNSTLDLRLAACDAVVFLDLPATACLRGIFMRQVCHGSGQRATLGVYNRLTVDVVRYILSYRRRMRPRVLAKITRHEAHIEVVRLTNRRAVRRWLTRLTGTPLP